MNTKTLLNRISRDPKILGGKPLVRGMRIGVDTILDDLACGYTFDHILKERPILEKEDIIACLVYASKTVREKESA
jgi:uncharacterized protein (DUF433 family)